jgi:ribosomal protein L30/L7E
MLATVEVEATPQILGMVEKVHHLVKVEAIA